MRINNYPKAHITLHNAVRYRVKCVNAIMVCHMHRYFKDEHIRIIIFALFDIKNYDTYRKLLLHPPT